MSAVVMTEKMENVRSWFEDVIDRLKVQEHVATVIKFANERPVAAVLIGVAVATSFIPAAAFVSFVVAMVIIGVLTLFVIEGTAILMGAGLLLFALCGSLVATVFIGMSLLIGLAAGRFTWRISAPLRTKVMGMCKGSDKAPNAAKEKGQYETDENSGSTGKANKVQTD